MFGAETWVLNKADELMLGLFERKILSWICGPVCEEEDNEELYQLYYQTDLVTTIRITSLGFVRYIVRMQDNLQCKKNHLGQAGGQKASGKAEPQTDGGSDEGCREAGS